MRLTPLGGLPLLIALYSKKYKVLESNAWGFVTEYDIGLQAVSSLC